MPRTVKRRISKRHRRHRQRTRRSQRSQRMRMRGGAFVNDERSFTVRLIGIIHDEHADIPAGEMYDFDEDLRNQILEWYTITTQRLINNGTIQHIRNPVFEYDDENEMFKVRFEYDDEHPNELEANIDTMLSHWEMIEEMPEQNNPIPEIYIDGVHWYPELDDVFGFAFAQQNNNQNFNQNQNQNQAQAQPQVQH